MKVGFADNLLVKVVPKIYAGMVVSYSAIFITSFCCVTTTN